MINGNDGIGSNPSEYIGTGMNGINNGKKRLM
jgi:hypothetical protein